MLNSLQTLRLSLLHVDFCQLDHHWQYENVISPFSRLYLITDGEGWVYHNEKKIILKPGYLYLIPSFTYSKYHCDQSLTQFYAHFLDEMKDGLGIFEIRSFYYEVKAQRLDYLLFERLLALNPERTIADSDPQIYDNSSDLLSFNLPEPKQSPGDYVETQGILLQLFSRFFSKHNTREEHKIKSYRRLASVIQYIHKNLHEKLTVEHLASNSCLNPDYFSRLFLKVLGVRPIDYINNKRLERAQLLLTTTDASLAEIADNVGISDVSYFSRLFKRRFSIPPTKYRETRWRV